MLHAAIKGIKMYHLQNFVRLCSSCCLEAKLNLGYVEVPVKGHLRPSHGADSDGLVTHSERRLLFLPRRLPLPIRTHQCKNERNHNSSDTRESGASTKSHIPKKIKELLSIMNH